MQTKEPKWTTENSVAVPDVMQQHNLTESELCLLVTKGYVRLRRVERELYVPTEDVANIPPWKVEANDQDGPFIK